MTSTPMLFSHKGGFLAALSRYGKHHFVTILLNNIFLYFLIPLPLQHQITTGTLTEGRNIVVTSELGTLNTTPRDTVSF